MMAIWATCGYIVIGFLIYCVTCSVFMLTGKSDDYDDEMFATGLGLGLAWPVIILISPILLAFAIAISLPLRGKSS